MAYKPFLTTLKRMSMLCPRLMWLAPIPLMRFWKLLAVNSPVMIQFSNGGGVFYAGKSLSNDDKEQRLQAQFPEQCMSMRWPRLMEFQ